MNQLFYDFIIFEDIFLHKPMLWAGFYNLGFGNLDHCSYAMWNSNNTRAVDPDPHGSALTFPPGS